MGQFSEHKLFGITLRESANDGSDFTNPDADYRRLFLGEDGLLHLRDSAGTVTDIGAGGSTDLDAIVAASSGQDIADALSGAAAPDAGNVFATMADVGGGGGVPSGSSFPGGPAANDLFYRTDLAVLYFYDGTRWLSVALFDAEFSMRDGAINGGLSATGVAGFMVAPFHQNSDIWLERCHLLTKPITTNDMTNYWEVRLYRTTGADVDAVVGSFVIDTSGDTVDTWSTDHSTGIFEVHNPAGLLLKLHVTKILAPGNLFLAGSLYYRLVGA